MSRYELTVDDVLNAISREHAEVPGGVIEGAKDELIVRSTGEAATVKELSRIPITSRGGAHVHAPIFLKDVAEIEDGLDEVKRISRFNGRPSVNLGIVKQRGSNIIEVAEGARKLTEELSASMPEGFEIAVSNDMTRFVKESTDELVFTIILSTILTGFVCFIFLGSVNATVNVLLAIPTSIMGTFMFLYFMGFTLNTFTLLALSLSIGIVVDDAIMVMENISRHKSSGKDRIEASLDGARQITFAAIAATLAVIAIFLPVAFMSGIIGKYFLEFGATVTVAVALSLLEALTLTPMRFSRMKERSLEESRFSKKIASGLSSLADLYGRALAYTLDHRLKVIGISVAVFAGSLIFMVNISKEFVPKQDQSLFIVRMKTQAGASLEFTDEIVKKAEEIISKKPEVLRYFSTIGGFTGGQSNSGMLFVTMKDPDKRPVDPQKKKRLTQAEFADRVRKELRGIGGGLKVSIQDLSMRGFTASRGYPVEFVVKGDDWKGLEKYSTEIARRMSESGLLTDVDTGYDSGSPEVRLVPDREAARQRGVSMASIGNSISAMVGGVRAGKFTEGGRRYDIRVRLREKDRRDPSAIKRLFVRNSMGEMVSLSELVDIERTSSPLAITRINRERSITVFANPVSGVSQDIAVKAALKTAKDVLPEGFTTALTGSAKTTADSFDSLLFALVIGIIVSYMVLSSQFNSYLHPLIILISLPFSFSGALIAIAITGNSLNIYSFIGLILLMGLVKKNSILLVEFTNQLRSSGAGVREALLEAGPVRLRPILMTAFSTIAAAIPPAMALGPGAETRIPMAVAVIGGMALSTGMTLFVVPAAYSLLSRFERE
jgi:HAE1 family hydrophobic/amphiphilic exporter-1